MCTKLTKTLSTKNNERWKCLSREAIEKQIIWRIQLAAIFRFKSPQYNSLTPRLLLITPNEDTRQQVDRNFSFRIVILYLPSSAEWSNHFWRIITDFNDPKHGYSKALIMNVNEEWTTLHDTFVNALYVTICHSRPAQITNNRWCRSKMTLISQH